MQNCPVSCGKCCADNDDFTFRTVDNTEVTCDWLSTAKRVEDYCEKWSQGKLMVRDGCPMSCGFCPSNPASRP